MDVVTETACRVLRRTTKKLKRSHCSGKYSNFGYKSLPFSVCQINFVLQRSFLLQEQLKMFLSELLYTIENIYFVIYLFTYYLFLYLCVWLLIFSFILLNTLRTYLYISLNYVLLFIYLFLFL